MNLFWLLTHFDVFCVLLLKRSRAIWNLFDKQTLVYSVEERVTRFLLFIYITSASLSLQLPVEAREDASNGSFSLSRNKKNKATTIQWKKLRHFDVIDDNEISHFSKF